MTHVACESKLRSSVRSSVHPRPGNWVAIESAVVYHIRAARAFSAGIKCRHCIYVANANQRIYTNNNVFYGENNTPLQRKVGVDLLVKKVVLLQYKNVMYCM